MCNYTINLFYFSREEITSAMRESVKMVERGEISQQDIDVQLLGKNYLLDDLFGFVTSRVSSYFHSSF